MARPLKNGLDYFALDVDIFEDPKILFASDKFGDIAELVAIKLLTKIYRNGYYLEWNDEVCVIMSKRFFSNMEASLLSDIVNELIKRGFFDVELYQKYGILTSKGIQKRWSKANCDAKRKGEILDIYNLLIPKIKEETPDFEEETPDFEEETPDFEEFSTQKKRKEKKIKEKRTVFSEEKTPDFIDKLIYEFQRQFLQSRQIGYVTSAKDRANMTKILNFWKKDNPEASTEAAFKALSDFISKCLAITDAWHYQRMSISHIFNQINNLRVILGKNKNASEYTELNSGKLEVL